MHQITQPTDTQTHTRTDRQAGTAVLLDAVDPKGVASHKKSNPSGLGSSPASPRLPIFLVRHIPHPPHVFSSFHHGHPSHLYASTGTRQREGVVVAARVVMPSSSSLFKKQLPVLAAAAALVIVGAAAALYLSKKKKKAEKSRYVYRRPGRGGKEDRCCECCR